MPDTEIQTGKFTVQTLPPLVEPPTPAPESLPANVAACANCHTPLVGPFCWRCGQHVADFHRSVWRFVSDFFDNTFCWDNKLFRTLGPLLKYPGLLTHDFMIGRRVRYVHPLRLFLFTSAVCLALLQYSHDSLGHFPTGPDAPGKAKHRLHLRSDGPGPSIQPSAPPTAAPAAVGPVDAAASASPVPAEPGKPAAKDEDDNSDQTKDDPAALGAVIRAAVAGKTPGHAQTSEDVLGEKVNQYVNARIAKAGSMEKFGKMVTENFKQKLSWVALALLPVFALALRAVYWRKDSFYFAHLIFSLHYHTFLLLFWTAYTALLAFVSFLPLHSLWEGLARLGLLWPPVYLYLILRLLHGDSRRGTACKVFLLGSIHLLAILIGVGAVGAMAVFTAGE